MNPKPRWETRSLAWIHQIRTDIDQVIRAQGMTPAEWIKKRGPLDVEALCRKLGLTAAVVVKSHSKAA
ncbi:MAG: hypothetical protein HYZ73_04250 [Elusimicrobia bacterium]|nr:hypothetical protein [Elusimicrobiota bacterium]